MPIFRYRAKAVSQGFTLIELMVVVAIVAILAAFAMPSYVKHIQKSKAKSAAADLLALSLALENRFQKQLAYPVYAHAVIAPTLAEREGTPQHTDFAMWVPSQAADFVYRINSTTQGYTVTAQTKDSPTWCTLTLNQRNERDSQNCPVLGHW